MERKRDLRVFWCIVFVFMLSSAISASGSISLIYPTASRTITATFSAKHTGLDFSANEGDPIVASAGGFVSMYGGCGNRDGWSTSVPDCSSVTCNPASGFSTTASGTFCNGHYGNYVQLNHGDNNYTKYAHMVSFSNSLRNGQWVDAGTTIGYVGSTGRSTGPHLHFELSVGGLSVSNRVDPMTWLGGGTVEPKPPLGDIRVDYYNSINIETTPVYTEYVNSLSRDWGTGGPGNGVLTDNFSARFTQKLDISEGWYKFSYFADDGIKIWIDGDNKCDKWSVTAGSGATDAILISGGSHEIWVDFRENSGEAKVSVSLVPASAPIEEPPTPTGAVRVDYFNSINIESTPVYTEYVNGLSRDWGTGGPGNGVLTDNFSARFTQKLDISEGWYKFSYFADDGIKIWIDGDNKCDKWSVTAGSGETDAILISGGSHEIWVDFRENSGEAKVNVTLVATAEPASPLTLSISTDHYDIETGAEITWTADSTGGRGEKQYFYRLYHDDTLIAESAYSTSPTYRYTPVHAGDYKLQVAVKDDSGELWANSSATQVRDPLTVTVSADIAEGLAGDTITWSAAFSGATGTAQFLFEVYRDDVMVGGSMDWSAITSYSFGTDVAGLYRVIVQYRDDISSTSVQSDVTAITQAAALPDLVPTAITWEADTIHVGDVVLMDSGISNTGEVDSDVFNVKWFVNGAEVGYGRHPGVPAQSSLMDDNSFFIWYPTETGTHTLVFQVDSDQTVAESDDANNESAVTVDVQEAVPPGPGVVWRPGDANNDEVVDIADVEAVLDFLVNGTEPASTANADADRQNGIKLNDLIWLINALIGS